MWPQALPPGGTIAVIAPAGPCDDALLERGLARLHGLGYRTQLGRHLLARRHYLAGDDDQRLADLHAAWRDPAVDAVWCARGGYGTMRLLPRIDWSLLRRPLPLLGYSDLTALQLALLARCDLISYTGPMIATGHGLGASAPDPDTVHDALSWLTAPGPRDLVNPGGAPLRVLRQGRAVGRLVGGNLSLVASLVGTPYLPDLSGAILVLEDVGEAPYRVDRMLTQLRLAGVLARLGGLVLGDFTECFPPHSTDPGPPLDELVLDILGEQALPVVSGLATGHIDRRLTLPLGATVLLDTAGPRLAVIG